MVKESLPSWVHQDSDEGLVHVNVGGLKRSLCSSTLKKFPDTRLGKLLACDSEEDILQVCDDYDVQQKEFYFDRNPGLFPYVLHFYQTGKLHIMEELCVFSFSQEIEYWGINEFFLDSCCSYRYHDRKLESSRHHSWDDESDVSSIDTSVDEISDLNRDMQHFQEVRYGNIRKCLWLTLENPGYSIPSKLFSLVSIGVVLTSIATMCINSIPEYQVFDDEGKLIEDPTMQALEVFCTCWFTFEVVTRLLLAPNRRKFFHHPLNIIDMVSVAPIYIILAFDLTVGSESELGDLGRLIQVFRLMRIFRVLKLARHSTGLRSLGATLRHSYREVGILLLYLAVGVSVFSGIAYTAEYEEDVGLDTIPACWWWGTVSMTTVGYGDVVPVTVAGKLAASGCILGGTLVVALPITIIFNKFSHFYRRQKALEASVRNNHRRKMRMSCENEPEEDEEEEEEEEGSDGDSRCLDDDDTDDIEEDDIDYEDEGGVINYSYVEHPSYTSMLRKKELHQL
ncbi:potassium voltage-gated channel subfamily S member 2 [Epinephelus fuscoguttatus]|uniref:potassium voltage-gated channel subfamily S member 2 n=1 Tax=Epinephelus lanceolatus TaxID=310571 RepID=UPI001447A2C7|nr:potassium voltage-gated channel subfamily S member 2 [Epinephelus lanceolatus]XP_049429814.1 potassium voltage-gated channel subfamily S member 2 [Epinephelus fuscoguttatus]